MRRGSNQGDMFDAHSRVREGDPDTSFAAAEKIVEKMTDLQLKVLDLFRSIHPRAITDFDLQTYFQHHGSTYRTRRAELTEMGLIHDTGHRKFQAGSNRILWIATPWKDELFK